MSLPTGTVTFLFTDIEDSTRLWEEHPEVMRAALARHDALAASAIERHEGTLVKSRGEGDSLFAVFARATDAVACACSLQQVLTQEPWPDEMSLRVRMALHTGEAGLRDGDYYGNAVNRCARLRAVAHGGQVLVSAPTQELARDALPPWASLRDLGRHRLRDLQRPEQVFHLCHPALPDDFPPLKSLDTLPNNLPQQLTSFIGREKEMGQIKRLLSEARLLTLTGSGGSGKTRLALQVAADVLEQCPDGVWLAELASLSDPLLVPQAVASALGVREEPGKTLTQTLIEFLKPRRLFLVLDNCEHVLPTCATLADSLLRACPHTKLLATSREALNVAGEQTYRVPSLSLPDPRHLPPGLESLTQYEAVRLFIDRAVLAQSSFAVTNQNAPALAQVCHRLDGIPLAIELAAARVRALPVEQIAAHLDDRFRLLTGGSRTSLPRHQTLRALIDWSYDLLDERERVLLRRLSVFAGGGTLEAAEAVCAREATAVEPWEVLDLLSALVDKSLVTYEEHEGAARYRLLETVRQYARDRLIESGESETVRGWHRDWFAAYARRMDSLLRGPESHRWWGEAEPEYPNLRAALEASLAGEDGLDAALQLVSTLSLFWQMRGNISEGREVCARVLSRVKESAATPAAVQLGHIALHNAGHLADRQGDFQAARALFEEALRLSRERGDPVAAAQSLNDLGYAAMYRGDFAAARGHNQEALRASQASGDTLGIGNALYSLGLVAHFEGDFNRARSYYEEALAIWRDHPNGQNGVRRTLLNLGDVARQTGDFDRARSRYQDSLRRFVQAGDRRGIAQGLEAFASLTAVERQAAERAARLYGAAESLREAIGMPLPTVARAAHEEPMKAVRSALGEQAFASAWAEGRIMPPEQAVLYALEKGGAG